MFPADAPRYVLAVAIDEPAGMHFGGEVAAPVFRQLAIATLGPANLPEGLRPVERAQAPTSAERVAVPDVRLLTVQAAVERLARAGFEARVTSAGDRVLTQDPLPGVSVAAGTLVALGRSPLAAGVVPDLRGLALRDALRLMRGSGIEVRAAGFGWVEKQFPPAGTPVGPRLVCRILLTPARGTDVPEGEDAVRAAGIPGAAGAPPVALAVVRETG
jgi:hypothetical protein